MSCGAQVGEKETGRWEAGFYECVLVGDCSKDHLLARGVFFVGDAGACGGSVFFTILETNKQGLRVLGVFA